MKDAKISIEPAFSAFNTWDIDGALALMRPDVSWLKASAGGKVVRKEEIRACWGTMGGIRSPCEPLAIVENEKANCA